MDDTRPLEKRRDVLDIHHLVEELKKDIPSEPPVVKRSSPAGGNIIREILSRAADDPKFLVRLAEDLFRALAEYQLLAEEIAALASGNLARIEFWTGKLDSRLSTWIRCRLQLQKW